MLRLSEQQQQTVLRLAQPLGRCQRNEFFRLVGVAVAAMDVPISDGELYRVATGVQRELLGAPALDGRDL
jgi:hypothetical protein